MSTILVDSNVLLDILTEDANWLPWSSGALEQAANEARLVINPVVYGEVSIRFATIEELEEALPSSVLEREDIPYEAAFLAGKVYVSYRRQMGTKSSLLPDFYVGAHAAIRGYRVLTRDVRRYRTYFPTLALIAPSPGV